MISIYSVAPHFPLETGDAGGSLHNVKTECSHICTIRHLLTEIYNRHLLIDAFFIDDIPYIYRINANNYIQGRSR